jgi:hypothetical protein
MANTILLKRSVTPGNVPNLAPGEIGPNLADRIFFYKDSDGILRPLYFFPRSFEASVGHPAVDRKTVNVIDPLVVQTSKVSVSWDDVADTDENDPELSNLCFKVKANNGSFDLTIIAADRGKVGGLLKLKYQIH